MLLTKFSNLQIIHTAGTNLTVADMLSRDFSTINTQTCQLQHKTLPPHIDFLQLKNNNILQPIHYLVKHEDVLPTQKNDSHLILADYGDDQFTLRIQDKGNVVKYTPLDSFSFQSVSSFLNKYKKPVKNKVKTLLQENPLLNETDLYETDDPVLKRIPHQHFQPSHELHTLFTEIQHHYFNDINLSQDILTNFTNSSPIINSTIENNAITQTTPKTTRTQSLPFFDPSFFAHRKAFDNFFLPSDTFLTVPILLQAQKDDPVLSTVFKWLKQKQRPHSLTPVIKAYSIYIHIINNSNIYTSIQVLTLFNIILLILGFLKKFLLRLNPLLTRHVYAFHSNFSMLHLVKHILMVIPVKNSQLRHLINFISSLIYLYGSQFSSRTA